MEGRDRAGSNRVCSLGSDPGSCGRRLTAGQLDAIGQHDLFQDHQHLEPQLERRGLFQIFLQIRMQLCINVSIAQILQCHQSRREIHDLSHRLAA